MSRGQFKKSKILLVEDEENLAIGLEYNLSEEGYIVKHAKDGKEAIDFYQKDSYDLIVLDIMLPYLNGFEVAKLIRESSPQIPILMLTAKTKTEDKVRGLQIGADDYLTKPFHLEELLLRIEGMLKRKQWYAKSADEIPTYSIGDTTINFENLTCTKDQETFQLTQIEAMALKYLIERKGTIVTRKELLENVWHITTDVETRTVDNFIARLRKYFEPDVTKPKYIKSVRGSGYIFEGE